jgi:hypothetical protein
MGDFYTIISLNSTFCLRRFLTVNFKTGVNMIPPSSSKSQSRKLKGVGSNSPNKLVQTGSSDSGSGQKPGTIQQPEIVQSSITLSLFFPTNFKSRLLNTLQHIFLSQF